MRFEITYTGHCPEAVSMIRTNAGEMQLHNTPGRPLQANLMRLQSHGRVAGQGAKSGASILFSAQISMDKGTHPRIKGAWFQFRAAFRTPRRLGSAPLQTKATDGVL